ncbi:MAG: heavy metal translocating P-type ATPase metal-binding domain-containing protein [Bernardetiaceae bacterium]|nr:heavy metal translocating P-type ATPase metal-binding domain-containing protein [Bernardetiaceae bacterium]
MTKTQTHCTHCGDLCNDKDIIKEQDLQFCCAGCQTVYHILDQNNLTDYYKIEQNPGINPTQANSKNRWEYLDEQNIRTQLIDFSDGNLTKVSFYIPSIHCASCVWLLEKLYRLHDAVGESSVNFPKKQVYISFYENEIKLSELASLLTALGYAPSIRADKHLNKEKDAEQKGMDKAFYMRLGVAGFCFGNIMLLSFPEYIGLEEAQMDSFFRQVFGYLNILLTLPVLLYSGDYYWRSAWGALQHRTINIDVPIVAGMIALFVRSFYEIIFEQGGGYLDSLAALIFLLLIGRWFQQKTFDNISFERDYRSYFPLAATVREGEAIKSKSISELKEKDILRIHNGELIPADAILLKGEGRIDYSFVTGESEAVKKEIGELIYAGGRQVGDIIEVQVSKSVSQSYLTRLWNAEPFQKDSTHEDLHSFTNRLSRIFTWVVLGIATAGAAYWYFTAGVAASLNVFTSVLIIACPCALALNAPFALGNAVRLLARRGIFIKSNLVLEKMAAIQHLVFDKTGTITHAERQAEYVGEPLSEAELAAVKLTVAPSTHPISRAIHRTIADCPMAKLQKFAEHTGRGVEALVGEDLFVRVGNAAFTNADINLVDDQFRTVSFVEINGKVKGFYALKQTFRADTSSLMERLRERGYQLSLLSGDRSDESLRLQQLFGQSEDLHFEQSPEDKMLYIEQLQKQGLKVMMLGDGLNDAGALKQSEVGIAISEDVHQFSPACDAVADAGSLAELPEIVHFSKLSMRIVYIGFAISLSYNLIGLSFALQNLLSPLIAAILMPISSITVVGLGMLLTGSAFKKVFSQIRKHL